MDKDNRVTKSRLTTPTREGLETLLSEAQQQTLSALLLTLAGLFLTIAGLVTILFKLNRIAGCKFLLMTQRLASGWNQRQTSNGGKLPRINTNVYNLIRQRARGTSTQPINHFELGSATRSQNSSSTVNIV